MCFIGIKYNRIRMKIIQFGFWLDYYMGAGDSQIPLKQNGLFWLRISISQCQYKRTIIYVSVSRVCSISDLCETNNIVLIHTCSGGGGNFTLSTSLTGYVGVHGVVMAMTYDGYGLFYTFTDNRLVDFIYICIFSFLETNSVQAPRVECRKQAQKAIPFSLQ